MTTVMTMTIATTTTTAGTTISECCNVQWLRYNDAIFYLEIIKTTAPKPKRKKNDSI